GALSWYLPIQFCSGPFQRPFYSEPSISGIGKRPRPASPVNSESEILDDVRSYSFRKASCSPRTFRSRASPGGTLRAFLCLRQGLKSEIRLGRSVRSFFDSPNSTS